MTGQWPHFDQGDIDEVSRILASGKVNYWTGHHGKAFEQEFADYVGTRHAIAVANGTLALDLALLTLDLQPDDEVIVTPRTFIASASSVINAGAKPVFADVDASSQNLSADTIGAVITSKTKAVICVHLGGMPCDMDPIMEVADQHGLAVIEDCAQAHGARYKGRSVGSIGHVGCWSFCQDKIMSTAGEGGMVTTNDSVAYERMWSFKDHGKSRKKMMAPADKPGFRWVHDSIGTNWRLTEIQSAIGRRQLRKLDQWQQRRVEIASEIWNAAGRWDALRVLDFDVQDFHHAAYRAYLFVRPERLAEGWSRDRIMMELNRLSVPTFVGSCGEVYREKAFACAPLVSLPNAKELFETSLCLQVHPTLIDEDVGYMIDSLHSVMAQAQE